MPVACMQATLYRRYHLSAALGVAAVAFRQTNAVWVAFVLGMALVNRALEGNLQAKRLPAEKQLLYVLRSSWQVMAFSFSDTGPYLGILRCAIQKIAAMRSTKSMMSGSVKPAWMHEP